MATDLDIARAATLKPIAEIATRAGIPADALEPYGKYKAKIGLDFIRAQADRPDGALVLVTLMLVRMLMMLHAYAQVHSLGMRMATTTMVIVWCWCRC